MKTLTKAYWDGQRLHKKGEPDPRSRPEPKEEAGVEKASAAKVAVKKE